MGHVNLHEALGKKEEVILDLQATLNSVLGVIQGVKEGKINIEHVKVVPNGIQIINPENKEQKQIKQIPKA